MDPLIQSGTILVYRVFDIAEEVDLSRVESILSNASGKSRLSIARGGRNAVIMRNAPVRLSLGNVGLKSIPASAEISGTIWDYGVVSLVYQIQISPGTPWSALISIGAILTGNSSGLGEIDHLAQQKIRELATLLAPALKQSHQWETFEDYQIYFLESLTGFTNVQELVEKGQIPELLLAEPTDQLSLKIKSEILQNLFQYTENDFAVIDWNSAVVCEPQGQRDIVDVIEFALTHLLEFRYYDDLLDRRLDMLYNSIEVKRKGSIWGSRFSTLSREASIRYIEISEFLERIENSLKVVGDFYVAVIYRNAIRRFRIPDWQNSITRKMNLLARVSQLLQGEMEAQRVVSLDIIIILLIAFEILQTLIKGLVSP